MTRIIAVLTFLLLTGLSPQPAPSGPASLAAQQTSGRASGRGNVAPALQSALLNDKDRCMVATFDSDEQLRSYVRWATLKDLGGNRGKFEQGSSLAGFERWESSPQPLNDDDPTDVTHNPSPSML